MDLSDAKKILEKGRKILLKTGPWRLILICLCGILIVALSSGTGEKKDSSTGRIYCGKSDKKPVAAGVVRRAF